MKIPNQVNTIRHSHPIAKSELPNLNCLQMLSFNTTQYKREELGETRKDQRSSNSRQIRKFNVKKFFCVRKFIVRIRHRREEGFFVHIFKCTKCCRCMWLSDTLVNALKMLVVVVFASSLSSLSSLFSI